jgi:hypothetical protein
MKGCDRKNGRSEKDGLCGNVAYVVVKASGTWTQQTHPGQPISWRLVALEWDCPEGWLSGPTWVDHGAGRACSERLNEARLGKPRVEKGNSEPILATMLVSLRTSSCSKLSILLFLQGERDFYDLNAWPSVLFSLLGFDPFVCHLPDYIANASWVWCSGVRRNASRLLTSVILCRR